LLSLHRFDEAAVAGKRARDMRPDDPFNYGVIGDGLLELGRYPEAFAAFQRMVDMRPNAASYARASYAQELQGQLEAALATMQRAANATSPRDAEGLSWTLSQVGDLLLRLNRLAEADACYRQALAVFSGHPFALLGQVRVLAARKQDAAAIALATRLLQQVPSMRLAALLGDLHARNARASDAERFYALAETIGRDATSNDESLAGFLAERGRKLEDAVSLAERAAARRQDVHTLDALAWAYFRAGRVQEAAAAADKAIAVGTRERRIVLHAAAIKAALGDAAAARALAARAAPRDPDVDVLATRPMTPMLALTAGGEHLRAAR
jgi:tetratricopeptide (TPR) repeat protein